MDHTTRGVLHQSAYDPQYRNRILAGILGVLLLAFVLSSTFMIALESAHACPGDDCPICDCIAQCESSLRLLEEMVVRAITAIVPILLVLLSIPLIGFELQKETLVTQKVRLDN